MLGVIAFFFLSDWSREAHWLSLNQRESIEERLRNERAAAPHAMSMARALRSRIVLLLGAVSFLNYFVSYGFYFWFPTMLKRQSSLSDLRVGFIGVIPYAVMFVAMILNGGHSDKRMERRWHAAIPMFIAAIGALGLAANFGSLPVSVLFFGMIASANAFLRPSGPSPQRCSAVLPPRRPWV